MTEVVNQEVVDNVVNEDQQDGPSSAEQRALEMGWRPKEEFDGDEDSFIDAKEFVRRKPLFDKIEYQSRELKEVKKALRFLQDHHEKVKETEFTRAVNALKAAKKQAFEEGNADLIVELDEQLDDVKAAQQAFKVTEQQAKVGDAIHPNFVSWVENNSWYAQDTELRSFADASGLAYAKANPSLSPEDVLKYVTKRVKTAFPEKFRNPLRDKQNIVEGSSSAPKGKKTDNYELSEEEERTMKTFVRQGIMTKESYIAELKKVKGVA